MFLIETVMVGRINIYASLILDKWDLDSQELSWVSQKDENCSSYGLTFLHGENGGS